MTENHDINSLKKKSLQGVVALIQQTFIIQIIGVVSTLIQAAYLNQIDFGILGISNTIISFLTYFTDIGLAGALIQKKEELTKKDLATTFTIQQILAVIVLGIGIFFSPAIAGFYRLESQGVVLFQFLLISFFISSFKTIPAILLERKLSFHKLVVPQILETLTYNILLTVLIIRGFGLTAIMWSALARSIVGLVTIFLLSPWKISIGLDKKTVRSLFKFGIPYQVNSFIAMAKDDILFLFLGRLLPLSSMGYITLAKKLADLPLRTIMDSVTRVTFPAFSRMQHNTSILRKALEHTTFGIATLVFPIYISAIFFIQPFIELLPRYAKWEPALPSFYLFCLVAIVASFSTPLVNGLSAIGKIRITSLFMIMWLVLTWILVIPFVLYFGFNGFALALLVVSLTVILVIKVMQKFVPFSFVKNMRVPFLGAICMAILYTVSLPHLTGSWHSLTIIGILGVGIYGGLMWYFEKRHIMDIVKGFLK